MVDISQSFGVVNMYSTRFFFNKKLLSPPRDENVYIYILATRMYIYIIIYKLQYTTVKSFMVQCGFKMDFIFTALNIRL